MPLLRTRALGSRQSLSWLEYIIISAMNGQIYSIQFPNLRGQTEEMKGCKFPKSAVISLVHRVQASLTQSTIVLLWLQVGMQHGQWRNACTKNYVTYGNFV